jgi:predicted  nucleic acid-binding Zn-ribbon protein
MTTSPQTTISYTLEDFLERFEQKIDKQLAEINQKIDKQSAELNQKIDKQSADIKQEFVEVNQKLNKLEIGLVELSGEIKVLDEKFKGFDKRIDNQEFLNRGILGALVVALVAGAAKLLGWLPPS